jgi:hypothetical protein
VYDGYIMMQRTQILLPEGEHRRARRRAAELGISLAEYIRRLVAQDLDGPRSRADRSALFDLGDSGGSDIAREKDAYLADAVAGLGTAGRARSPASRPRTASGPRSAPDAKG